MPKEKVNLNKGRIIYVAGKEESRVVYEGYFSLYGSFVKLEEDNIMIPESRVRQIKLETEVK